jgi:hypothetical protein
LLSRRLSAERSGSDEGNQYQESDYRHVPLEDKGETPNAQRRTDAVFDLRS